MSTAATSSSESDAKCKWATSQFGCKAVLSFFKLLILLSAASGTQAAAPDDPKRQVISGVGASVIGVLSHLGANFQNKLTLLIDNRTLPTEDKQLALNNLRLNFETECKAQISELVVNQWINDPRFQAHFQSVEPLFKPQGCMNKAKFPEVLARSLSSLKRDLGDLGSISELMIRFAARTE